MSGLLDELLEMGLTVKTCMDKVIGKIVQTEGLTGLQTLILVGVKKNLISNISSLSKEFGIGQANASTICKKMERDGFICRIRDKCDERIVMLSITPKGLQTLDRLSKKCNQFNSVLKSVTQEDFDSIMKGFYATQKLLNLLIENKDILEGDKNLC